MMHLRRMLLQLRSLTRALTGELSATWTRLQRLLSDPAWRERVLARVVFASIFAFAIGAFDFLITSGPDWSPGATAAAAPAPARLAVLPTAFPLETPPPAPANFAEAIADPDAPIPELLGGPDTRLASWESATAPLGLDTSFVAKPTEITYNPAAEFAEPVDKTKAPSHS